MRALEPARLGIQAYSLGSLQQITNRSATGVLTRAMSLDQQVTNASSAHELEVEPMSPRITHEPTGEHAAELTPNTALIQPIADLTLREVVSDTETVTTVVLPKRRASFSTQNDETTDETTKERARRNSAQ